MGRHDLPLGKHSDMPIKTFNGRLLLFNRRGRV